MQIPVRRFLLLGGVVAVLAGVGTQAVVAADTPPTNSPSPTNGPVPTTCNGPTVGARTIEQLQSNLASLAVTLTPEQIAALNEPSTPSLDFPAAITTEMSPMFGFGGATVDGIELPVWPQPLTSSARY